MAAEDKTKLTLYLDASYKDEVDEIILDKRIKNFQEGYRKIFDLGLEQFKKTKIIRREG